MAEKTINIGGRLHSTATGNVVTGANEVFDDTKGKTQAEINANTYSKEETYNKNQLNELITTPNVQYITVPTFNSLPALGSANTIYRVSNWDGGAATPAVDASKYSEYAWDGSNYVLLSVKSAVDEVFDVSVFNAESGVAKAYETLTAALGSVPANRKKGGMSIKFIQTTPATYNVVKTEGVTELPTGTELDSASSIGSGTYTASQLSDFSTLPTTSAVTYYIAVTEDETTTYTTWVITRATAESQEYVQYRLMKTAWSNVVGDWQGVDNEPVAGSSNLVKSGGVAELAYAVEGSLYKDVKGFMKGYYALLNDTINVDAAPTSNNNIYCRKLKVKAGQTYCYKGGKSSSTYTWPWATTDNSGNILERGNSRKVVTFYISIAHDGYLFVNCDKSYLALLVFYRMSEIDNVGDRIARVTNTLIKVKYSDNCFYPYLESHYNTLLNNNGEIYTSNGWYTSQPIYWGGYTEIKISRYRYLCQYDVAGNLVDFLSPSSSQVNATVAKASDAYYLMFCVEMSNRETATATFNSSFPSSYVPFSQTILAVNGVPVKDNSNEVFQDWVLSESYKISGIISYDDNGNVVTPVSVIYPDGGTGSITITRNSDGDVIELTATHTGMNKTLTAVFTRNSDGNVTNESITINQ